MDNSYFTLTVLNIYYNNTESSQFIIDAREQNFHCCADEDDIMYEDEVIESRKRSLSVYKKPILIYNNKSFNKLLCETKYKARVEKFINECGRNWDDITKIIKVEERIEYNKLTLINGRFEIKK
jgi:predicted nucleic acid-binding protein